MLFEIEAIEAFNEAEYIEDVDDEKAWDEYTDLCYDLNRFPEDSSLESMLPLGYIMVYDFVEGAFYAIVLRCLIDGDWVDLRLYRSPECDEMFQVLETTKQISIPYNVVTLEDIAHILERHMPEIIEWEKSHRS